MTCTSCGHDHPDPAQLYDIGIARRELANARRTRNEITRQQTSFGDKLAVHVDRHFAAEEVGTAGRALLIAAGALGALAEEQIPPQMLTNILAFAGDRLITDGQVPVP